MSFFHNIFHRTHGSLLCVGLDVDLEKIPAWFKHQQIDLLTGGRVPAFSPGEDGILEMHSYIAQSEKFIQGIINAFNGLMIQAVDGYAMCLKLNLGFYLNQGVAGLQALMYTTQYAHDHGIPVILDGKFGDIGNSSEQYAHFAYEVIGADAVTVSPYLGHVDALEPFLGRGDNGVFVLCHTSNRGANELQEVRTSTNNDIYRHVALCVKERWNTNHNCGLVMGATYPNQLAETRELVGEGITFLVPGIGKQAGALEQSVRGGINSRGQGAIFNVSRDIIFASTGEDMFEAAGAKAKWYNEEIARIRQAALAKEVAHG